mmetsp:Transcript_23040/g.22420  ORF Transcript_23040/g.22420 Transcript_23040/m.22420 type:complete len:459 (-) Transcript_23040:29-1405(-)
MFMEFIHLGGIMTCVTFHLEKKALEIDLADPKSGFGVGGVFYAIGATAASITNSNLLFKELILVDTFISHEMLVKQLAKNYGRQGVLQFYKLLGSSDLIGNPLGLVDKLGTGVFEFFSEPKKGLLKGPEEFVGGMGRGVKSLVTNVVSGSFECISKISGSLYSIVKNVGGDDVQLKKPDHVFDGIYLGVSGGLSEIVGGITGLVTKPYERTKEKGAKGMLEGMGQGLYGALTAPVTAALRVGTSVAQGVSSTADTLGSLGKNNVGDSQYSRFRPPRYINIRNMVKAYDQEQAMVYQIVADIDKGQYANSTLKYFCLVPEINKSGDLANPESMNANSLIIITDDHFLYVKVVMDQNGQGRGQVQFKSKLGKIDKCEVYQGQAAKESKKNKVGVITENDFFCLVLFKGTKVSQKFIAFEFTPFEKIYDILSISPECEANDDVRKKNDPKGSSLIQCCTSK